MGDNTDTETRRMGASAIYPHLNQDEVGFDWPKLSHRSLSNILSSVKNITMDRLRLISEMEGLIGRYDSAIRTFYSLQREAILTLYKYKGYDIGKLEDVLSQQLLSVITLAVNDLTIEYDLVLPVIWSANNLISRLAMDPSLLNINNITEYITESLGLPTSDILRAKIRRYLYEYHLEVSSFSLAEYKDSATKALEDSISPEAYLESLLRAEKGIHAHAFIFKPDPLFELDRNGYRIRVFSGSQLNEPEKKMLCAYRLCQYASPDIDHDTNEKEEKKLPFFSTEVVFNSRMMFEPDDAISDSEREYHVVIVDKRGEIVGYVCLEEPLAVNNPAITFGSQRTTENLYPLEKVFGSDVLLELAPEIASYPVNSAADIIRLIPRANASKEELPNRDRVVIAFELAFALTNIIDRLTADGIRIIICDTELDKVSQIFQLLLGINPSHIEREPMLSNLPSPYDKLLEPRYRISDQRKRTVSVVAFELDSLTDQLSRDRRASINEILDRYSKAENKETKREVLADLFNYSFNHIKDTRLGREKPLMGMDPGATEKAPQYES